MKNLFLTKTRWLVTIMLFLSFGLGQMWATDCQLKVWDKASNAYVTWRTISDGYEFPNFYSCPYSGDHYAIAWANAEYGPTSSYPSNDYYYYQTQIYGKLVNGVAYKPTTLYAVYLDGANNYTSAPSYQLVINKYTITYVLTGLTLESGPGSVSETATSFDAYFSISSDYGYTGPVSGNVFDGWASYVIGGGVNVSYDQSSNHLNMTAAGQGGYFDDDLVVTLSATACVNTLTTPTGLSEANITTTSVDLSWNSVSNASSYTVQIYGSSYSRTITGLTTNSVTVNDLNEGPGATYMWTVKAIGSGTYCNSAESSTGDFETPSCTVLGDATNLTVRNPHPSDATKIRFEWDLGSNTEDHANKQVIMVSKVGGGSYNQDLNKDTEAFSMKLSDFSDGAYTWTIQAIGDGTSYCSSSAVAGPAVCFDAIAETTPSNIKAVATSASTATISWNAVDNATYYEVSVKNNSTNVVVCNDIVIGGTSFAATGLSENVEYRVELQAFNYCEEGSVKSTTYTFYTNEYTVHWYVNGETWEGSTHGSPATTVRFGNRPSPLPTAPDAGDFCGSAFMGWTDHEITGSSGQPSPLFKTIAPVVNSNINFYAVFADEQP